MKLYSWNVNGIRAVTKKGEFEPFIEKFDPDILCLQETKADQGQSPVDLPQYHEYWNSSKNKKGYSGTAIFTKIKPINVVNDIPEEFVRKASLSEDSYGHSNEEGRVIAAEFEEFYVVTAYTPNAKDDLSRIPLRVQWDKAIAAYCNALQTGDYRLDGVQGNDEKRTNRTNSTKSESRKKMTQQSAKSAESMDSSTVQQFGAAKNSGKPVIYCGDMNVAHTEDDLARPKENVGKKGFTDEERQGFENWLKVGFIDTLRLFKQGNGFYTWWTFWANARARNVGWRIDYVLVSESLKDRVVDADIHPEQMGSDHCPVSIEIDY